MTHYFSLLAALISLITSITVATIREQPSQRTNWQTHDSHDFHELPDTNSLLSTTFPQLSASFNSFMPGYTPDNGDIGGVRWNGMQGSWSTTDEAELANNWLSGNFATGSSSGQSSNVGAHDSSSLGLPSLPNRQFTQSPSHAHQSDSLWPSFQYDQVLQQQQQSGSQYSHTTSSVPYKLIPEPNNLPNVPSDTTVQSLREIFHLDEQPFTQDSQSPNVPPEPQKNVVPMTASQTPPPNNLLNVPFNAIAWSSHDPFRLNEQPSSYDPSSSNMLSERKNVGVRFPMTAGQVLPPPKSFLNAPSEATAWSSSQNSFHSNERPSAHNPQGFDVPPEQQNAGFRFPMTTSQTLPPNDWSNFSVDADLWSFLHDSFPQSERVHTFDPQSSNMPLPRQGNANFIFPATIGQKRYLEEDGTILRSSPPVHSPQSDKVQKKADVQNNPERPRKRRKPAERPKKYQCRLCDDSFSNQPEVAGHSRKVHGERNFKCPKCPKAYFEKRNLDRHHTDSHEGRFQCGRCGKEMNQSSLARHNAYAHKEFENV